MAQHKWHKEIKLNDTQGHILSFTIIFGSLISAIYFFGGWGMFIWFMFALAICAAGG